MKLHVASWAVEVVVGQNALCGMVAREGSSEGGVCVVSTTAS